MADDNPQSPNRGGDFQAEAFQIDAAKGVPSGKFDVAIHITGDQTRTEFDPLTGRSQVVPIRKVFTSKDQALLSAVAISPGQPLEFSLLSK